MRNGNGHGAKGSDRFGPARRQKKHRDRKENGWRCFSLELDDHLMAEFASHLGMSGEPKEFLRAALGGATEQLIRHHVDAWKQLVAQLDERLSIH